MGIAVVALMKHNLDTSSIEVLAEQLAERLDAMVIYGYMDDWMFERDAPFDFVVKGYAGTNEQNIYKLRWEWYYDTVLGLQVDYPNHVPTLRPVPANERYWTFELTTLQQKEDDPSINIYRDCFDPNVFYAGKWGRFVSPFINDDENGWWERDVLEFRQEAYHFQQLLGDGSPAYYYPDSNSEAANLLEISAAGTWDDVLRFIKELETTDTVLDMCQWYREDQDYLEEEPIMFMDDFSNFMVRNKTG